jgi:hypothetical protein
MKQHSKIFIPLIASMLSISILKAQNVGINTSTPTSPLDVNGQITIQQKNFGGYGGLLIKGGFPTLNYPNIAFSTQNIFSEDIVTGLFSGNIISSNPGAEAMDLTFSTTQNGFSGLTERLKIAANGNIGIGISPGYKLHVGNSLLGVRIEGPTALGGIALSVGGNGDILIDKPGTIGGRFTIKENGNIGIGNNNPNTNLTFAPTLGKKITLYPGNTGDVGFGVAGNRLQIFADNPNADVAIGYDVAGTFNEKFAFKPNGALAVNGSTGNPRNFLMSNGTGPAEWKTADYLVFPFEGPAASFTIPDNYGLHDVPGSSVNFTITERSKVLISYKSSSYKNCLVGSCENKWELRVFLGGSTPIAKYGILVINYAPPDLSTVDYTHGPTYLVMNPGTYTLSAKVLSWFNAPVNVTVSPSVIIIPSGN